MAHNGKVCVRCEVEMRPAKNGVMAVEMGTQTPLALWRADLWECPVCKWQGILGWAQTPESWLMDQAGVTKLAEEYRADKPVFLFWINALEKRKYEDAHQGEALGRRCGAIPDEQEGGSNASGA